MNKKHDHWATPPDFYKNLNKRFNFNFDPCPLFGKENGFNGLEVEWGTRNYVNPPYNRFDKPKFIKKAYEEYKKGKLVVMLLPVCTSTKDFHNIILPNAKIEFIEGRLKFIEYGTKQGTAGRQDLMLVIFEGCNK